MKKDKSTEPWERLGTFRKVDLSKCPECGGENDRGHDRCYPPNPYLCSKCDPHDDPIEDWSIGPSE